MQAGSKQVQSAQGSPKQAVLSTFCIAAPNPATAAQLSREKPGNPQVDGAPRGQEKAVHTQLQNMGGGLEQRRAGPQDPAARDGVGRSPG